MGPISQGARLDERPAMLDSGRIAVGCGAIRRTCAALAIPRRENDVATRLTGSASEKVFVTINGVRQGMFLKSTDAAKPVLLFLHGGPGMPEYFLDRTHPTGLENDFTVCWWEQRGAGISYRSDIPPASMTTEQLVRDAISVTEYLRERFGHERIYLLGHSWGSFLGIQVAARAPERYHAYIGMGQVAYQQRSEVLAYEYELEQFRKCGKLRDGADAGGGAGHHGRAAAGRVHEGARRGHAQPGHRHDAGHEVRGHGRVPAGVADARLHDPGEDRHGARQGVLPRRHVGRLPGDGSHRQGAGAPDARLLLPGQVRPHVQLRPRQRLLREAAGAGEGLLHVRAVGPQPGLRGARPFRRILREDVLAGETRLADAE